ncbi:MAG: c-type cytochrome biogenesis protein CcsB [Candidatus Sericytochromatia bacterium]|nr:c-type cytochrome biogenesis protein CcsB [Candidatus Sericytochromatia bacterium]
MNLLALEQAAVSTTFVAGLLALVAFVLHLGLRREGLRLLGQGGMAVALVGAGVTLVCRALIAQHAPWSNLWESMITMLFVTLAFYFFVEVTYKPRHFGVVAAPLVMILIGGASILPPHFKGAAPLMPALQSYWIKVHVLLVLASYAAFTMSFAAALAYLFFNWQARRAHPPMLASAGPGGEVAVPPAPPGQGRWAEQLGFFDELTYRLILMGFPLLMFGIITGAMWANGAWGTYWSWDPKETWSLITWFVYAAYLHARLTHDWTGTRAAWLGVAGFASMVVTYIGVNYLSSGLHSYGFIR